MKRTKRLRGRAAARVPADIHFDRGEYPAPVAEAAGSGRSMTEVVRTAVRKAPAGEEAK